MATVATLGRAWLMLLIYFVSDDWEWMQSANQSDLSWDYLFRDWNGHMQPFAFLMAWMTTRLAPLNIVAAMLPLVILLAITTWILLLLLRRLVRPGWVRLGFFTFFCVSPIPVAALSWWAAALELVPVQLAMVLALYATARAATGSRWWIVASMGAFAFGLLAREKSLIIALPVIGLLIVMTLRGDVSRSDVKPILLRVAVAYGALTAVHLAAYSVTRERLAGNTASLRLFIDSTAESLVNALLPVAVGGPWRLGSQALDLWVDPPMSAVILGIVASCLAVAFSVAVNGRVATACWTILAVFLMAEMLAMISTRAGLLGAVIGRDTRYFADAGLIIALFGALAWSGVTARSLREKLHAPAAMTHPWVAASLISALALSAFTSTWHYGRAVHANTVKSYLSNALEGLTDLDTPVLFDGGAPEPWSWPLVFRDGRISHFFRAAGADVRFDEPTTNLHMVKEDGTVVEAEIGKGFDSLIGPVPGCGWQVDAESPALIPITQGGYAWTWGVRVNYLAGGTTPGTLGIGAQQYPVTFQKGPGSIFLVHRGNTSPVVVAVDEPGVTVCVDQVRLGDIHPADDDPNNG